VAIYSLLLFVFADCERGCVLLPFELSTAARVPPQEILWIAVTSAHQREAGGPGKVHETSRKGQ